MSYAVGLYNSQPIEPGEYVPDSVGVYLVKTANKSEAVTWVKKNSKLITRVIGSAPIVYTNNRGKVIK